MPSVRGGTGRSRRLKNEINVVPYIDVMLVLLVIFMVTAPMITPGLIELPSVGQASEVRSKPLEVQVGEDGTISLRMRDAGQEFEKINSQNLVAEVRTRLTADTPVVIAADGRVPYETVMRIMDQLRSNGISKLGLLVDQKSAPER
ncbi:protein TolR [Parapusillimonas granuli]|uniref:Protein TolR n=1 Tax=Parapusillimonas granuli TaxID=380911 RepID=A0A853G6P0_9BURK|nr:protein TolR [Parapusillimonas granuli]MBB5216066.1 biopolymer transport protein TolR [Parapusillimonas granuli]MEB2401338.1 protein TolR [Alcaligenaceae bacterium]NYT50640.1 protein TolR [Parapusillimonas granuli]